MFRKNKLKLKFNSKPHSRESKNNKPREEFLMVVFRLKAEEQSCLIPLLACYGRVEEQRGKEVYFYPDAEAIRSLLSGL